ncbi:MAG: TlpA disulfide reductase family protein [Planctomycetota bacterium]
MTKSCPSRFLLRVIPAVLGGLLSRGPAALADTYPPSPGTAHTPIVLPTLEHDRAVALSSFRGKKVLLVHFASWSEECRKEMPRWHEKMKPFVDTGKLVVIGVAQEQHADRCRLFAQWHGIDWPILHDALNLTGVEKVPTLVAIDEHGLVRNTQPDADSIVAEFITKTYDAPKVAPFIGPDKLPDPRATRRYAGEARRAEEWREHGNALILAGKPAQIDEAIDKAYPQVIGREPGDADSLFRLGVAHMIRHESPQRRPDDFQSAIDAWRKAHGLRSRNEVFHRRIQQYGPCVDKPFAFYGWVATARKAIVDRGDESVALQSWPCEIERAKPAKKFKYDKKQRGPSLDEHEKANEDRDGLVGLSYVAVPGTEQEHKRIVQELMVLRPDAARGIEWAESADPPRLWLEKPKTGRVSKLFVECAKAPGDSSENDRVLTFAVRLPSKKGKSLTVRGTLVYSVRQGGEGAPQTLSRDVKIKIDPK